jgi:hypothetical protein
MTARATQAGGVLGAALWPRRRRTCQDVVMTDSGQVGDTPGGAEQFKLDLVWPDDVGAEAQVVNKIVFSYDENNQELVYMYLGHVAPPPWLTPEAAKERAKELGNKFPVEPKGSFIMSRQRALEMWLALGKHLGKELPE